MENIPLKHTYLTQTNLLKNPPRNITMSSYRVRRLFLRSLGPWSVFVVTLRMLGPDAVGHKWNYNFRFENFVVLANSRVSFVSWGREWSVLSPTMVARNFIIALPAWFSFHIARCLTWGNWRQTQLQSSIELASFQYCRAQTHLPNHCGGCVPASLRPLATCTRMITQQNVEWKMY